MSGPSRSGDPVRQLESSISTSISTSNARISGKASNRSITARSGFPLLATSSFLVQEISQEVTALLLSFTQAWSTAIHAVDRLSSVDLPSPFVIFKELYFQRGWHLFQMHWSEHQETRLNMYHAFIRVLTDFLRPRLPLLQIGKEGLVTLNHTLIDETPTIEVLNAFGILFALKLIQSTTSLTPSDSISRHSPPRIPIEADLYHVLLALPLIAQTSKALGEWDNIEGLQPVDDVICILKDMTGDPARKGAQESALEDGGDCESDTLSEASDEQQKEKESAFEVLLPTSFEARPALINNRLSTKAETEKEKGVWGRLRASDTTQDGIGMSRADLMRNLVRKRLDLPLRSGEMEERALSNENQCLTMDAFTFDKRGHSKDDVPVIMPPGVQAEEELQERCDEVALQRETYDAMKRQRFGGADFTSLLPTSGDNTIKTGPSVEPADLQTILASARSRVALAMRKSLASQRQNNAG